MCQISLKAGVSTLRKRNVITWQLCAQLCDVKVETRSTTRCTCVLRRFLLKNLSFDGLESKNAL